MVDYIDFSKASYMELEDMERVAKYLGDFGFNSFFKKGITSN